MFMGKLLAGEDCHAVLVVVEIYDHWSERVIVDESTTTTTNQAAREGFSKK
jgi:hypothetical protein